MLETSSRAHKARNDQVLGELNPNRAGLVAFSFQAISLGNNLSGKLIPGGTKSVLRERVREIVEEA